MENISRRIIKFSILGIAFFLPLSSGAVNTLIAIGIIFWVLQKIVKKEMGIKPSSLNLPLLLFFIISGASIINSIEPNTSLRGLVKVLKYLGIYFLMVENISDIKTARFVVRGLILGAVIVCIDGVAQYVFGKDIFRSNPLMSDIGLKRMTATYRHCNDFGVYLVTIGGLVWALALYEFKKKAKWLGLAAAGLVTMCIVLTFSRGAALGLFGGALLMGLIKKDKLILLILAISIIALPFVMPESIKGWAKDTDSFLDLCCNKDRIVFYRSSIEMIKDHPLIGVGVNTYMKAYPKYKVKDGGIITPDNPYAHNNYLQMAGEIGLLGLGVFLWIMVSLFLELRAIYSGVRHPNSKSVCHQYEYVKNVVLGLGCGIWAFLLNGLTESSFYFSKIVVVFWVVIGLGMSLKFITDEKKS